jgi:hypothetical protein
VPSLTGVEVIPEKGLRAADVDGSRAAGTESYEIMVFWSMCESYSVVGPAGT